jgi:2-oxoglutarate ferredoxin oxidoreductase subunit beta
MTESKSLKIDRKDFQTANDVRWCPGCGDYAILATVQRTFAELELTKENTVFISGIGCAARFPYYMNTYGMHSIHGRAPTIATGLKITRPDLSVWVITGDGDSLSIGGNHTLHMLRRNVDLNVLLFNNRVYGLTKGQYSPTSKVGMVAKSTPLGSIDYPVNPLSFALGAGATFVARSIDTDAKHLGEMLKRAHEHKGTSFVEIYQNCVVFNDDVFSYMTGKETKASTQLILKHGEPLLFANGTKGIGFDAQTLSPMVIDLAKEPERLGQVLIHNENDENGLLANLYARLDHPEFPVPIGVFRAVSRPTYDGQVKKQQEKITEQKGKGSLKDLLLAADTWKL